MSHVSSDHRKRIVEFMQNHLGVSAKRSSTIESSVYTKISTSGRADSVLYVTCIRNIIDNFNSENIVQNTLKNAVKDLKKSTEFSHDEVENVACKKRLNYYIQKLEEGISSKHHFIKCKHCKSEDVIWREQQTRSADEAATLFFSCNNCGSKWKQ